MKRKWAPYALIAFVCIMGAFICFSNSSPRGDTIESREALLDNAISKGGWSIMKEAEIDGRIISCAYNTDIIIGGAVINGEWYDLIWFPGAQTEHAEIIYTVNGVKKEPLRYDTADMDLISVKNPEKDYSIEVCYYDSAGNKYE